MGTAAAVLVASCLAFAAAPAAAISADFTWSGGAVSGTPGWATGSNWVGGTAPSGTVGTLTFPTLGSCAPLTNTCYASNNDVTGLTVNRISIDDAVPYNSLAITGNTITLNGGIDATAPPGASSCCAQLDFPIALGAANTWSVDGTNGGFLGVGGGLTGSSHMLAINVANNAEAGFSGDNEVGAVSINGADSTLSGLQASLNGSVFLDGKLNGTDSNAVNLNHAQLASDSAGGSTVGALTSTGGQLSIVRGVLTVAGGATFDSNSLVFFDINAVGATPGIDYGQLSATGAVSLTNSSLVLRTDTCPLHPGDVDTLVTTTGSVIGAFLGVPDGSLVTTNTGPTCPSTFRINYSPQTVTATVVSSGPPPSATAPANTTAPAISGSPAVGSTLSCSQGSWSGSTPQSYAYQWLRDGGAITGATSSTYNVTSADGGHGLTCRVTASNPAGSASATSASVNVPAPQPPPVDSTAPVANLSGSTSQKLGKTVAVKVSCASEACIASASGTVKVPKVGGASAKTYKTKKIIKPIAKGATVKIKLGLSRAARKAIKRALRPGKYVTMKLTITVTDAAGNTKKLTRKVKIRL